MRRALLAGVLRSAVVAIPTVMNAPEPIPAMKRKAISGSNDISACGENVACRGE